MPTLTLSLVLLTGSCSEGAESPAGGDGAATEPVEQLTGTGAPGTPTVTPEPPPAAVPSPRSVETATP